MRPKNIKFNIIREPFDPKVPYSIMMPVAGVIIPPAARAYTPPIFSAQLENDCSANAGVRARMSLAGPLCPMLSRLDLYYEEAEIEGTIGQDQGVRTIGTIAMALEKYGVAPEIDWPYEQDKINDKPTDAMVQDALQWICNGAKKLTGLTQLKQYIAIHQQPVLIGMTIFQSALTPKVDETGIIPMPSRFDSVAGGHAIVVSGYDDNMHYWNQKGGLILDNSWGADVGNGGVYYMSYAFLRQYCFDFWVIQ